MAVSAPSHKASPAAAAHVAGIPVRVLPAGHLLTHCSLAEYRGTPPHFGANAENRYDAFDRSYGVLYAAPDLATALMESVFHRHRWSARKRRTITRSELRRRTVRVIGVLASLRLADLTVDGTMAAVFGLNLAQLTNRDYRDTQRISMQVAAARDERGAPTFDGICYPSRNNYPGTCLALFEWAADKLDVCADIALDRHREWPAFQRRYGVVVMPI